MWAFRLVVVAVFVNLIGVGSAQAQVQVIVCNEGDIPVHMVYLAETYTRERVLDSVKLSPDGCWTVARWGMVPSNVAFMLLNEETGAISNPIYQGSGLNFGWDLEGKVASFCAPVPPNSADHRWPEAEFQRLLKQRCQDGWEMVNTSFTVFAVMGKLTLNIRPTKADLPTGPKIASVGTGEAARLAAQRLREQQEATADAAAAVSQPLLEERVVPFTGRAYQDFTAAELELLSQQDERLSASGQQLLTCRYPHLNSQLASQGLFIHRAYWYKQAPAGIEEMLAILRWHPYRELGVVALSACPSSGRRAAIQSGENLETSFALAGG